MPGNGFTWNYYPILEDPGCGDGLDLARLALTGRYYGREERWRAKTQSRQASIIPLQPGCCWLFLAWRCPLSRSPATIQPGSSSNFAGPRWLRRRALPPTPQRASAKCWQRRWTLKIERMAPIRISVAAVPRPIWQLNHFPPKWTPSLVMRATGRSKCDKTHESRASSDLIKSDHALAPAKWWARQGLNL